MRRGGLSRLAALALCLIAAAPAAGAAKPPPRPAPPSAEVKAVLGWAVAGGDHADLPFAVIDKVAARIFVYGADGRRLGSAPVLVGSAVGDESAPGVGDRELSDIAPEERTTPAGRFMAGYAPAAGGRKVLWVDYATAISLHPVVTAHPAERRPQRLRSVTAADNRITYGCINVSADFYEKVVRPAFAGRGGVVYVLPETRPLEVVFPALAETLRSSGRAETDGSLNGAAPAIPAR